MRMIELARDRDDEGEELRNLRLGHHLSSKNQCDGYHHLQGDQHSQIERTSLLKTLS